MLQRDLSGPTKVWYEHSISKEIYMVTKDLNSEAKSEGSVSLKAVRGKFILYKRIK